MLQGKGVVAKAIVGCKIWFPHGSVGSIPTTRTNTAEAHDVIAAMTSKFGWGQYDRGLPTLPRSGSSVRIPSPAPIFLEQISCLERVLGILLCFPVASAHSGKHGGSKQALREGPSRPLSATAASTACAIVSAKNLPPLCDSLL